MTMNAYLNLLKVLQLAGFISWIAATVYVCMMFIAPHRDNWAVWGDGAVMLAFICAVVESLLRRSLRRSYERIAGRQQCKSPA